MGEQRVLNESSLAIVNGMEHSSLGASQAMASLAEQAALAPFTKVKGGRQHDSPQVLTP